MFEVTLDARAKQELAEQIAPLVIVKKREPDWQKYKECKDDLFAGKNKDWANLFIFDAFPEVQMENGDPEAWVKGVHPKGSVCRIYMPLARKWLRHHHNEINWLGKVPRNTKRKVENN